MAEKSAKSTTLSERQSNASEGNEFFRKLMAQMVAHIPSMAYMPADVKQEYATTLAKEMLENNVRTADQVKLGLGRLAEYALDNDFAPPPSRFVAWCLPDNLPSVDEAYSYACRQEWRHPAIYEAVKRIGSYDFKRMPEDRAFRRFKDAYSQVKKDLARGFEFEVPQQENLISAPQKTEAEIMEARKAAQEARDKLKRMFH